VSASTISINGAMLLFGQPRRLGKAACIDPIPAACGN
jgi:hypothetical protein